MRRPPPLAQPAGDYTEGEAPLNIQWIDGRPLYRFIGFITGTAGPESSAVFVELAGLQNIIFMDAVQQALDPANDVQRAYFKNTVGIGTSGMTFDPGASEVIVRHDIIGTLIGLPILVTMIYTR